MTSFESLLKKCHEIDSKLQKGTLTVSEWAKLAETKKSILTERENLGKVVGDLTEAIDCQMGHTKHKKAFRSSSYPILAQPSRFGV